MGRTTSILTRYVSPPSTQLHSYIYTDLTTTTGWGKKLSYCIAFSADGCADVTRRYVRDPASHAAPRARCSEGVLLHILREVNALRRKDIDKKQKFQLNAEDMREDAELRKAIIEALAYNVSRILPGGDASSSEKGKGGSAQRSDSSDAQKAAEARQASESDRVRASRGQTGSEPSLSRDQQQQ